ncbi:hypothetical protein [Actinoplanes subtropicus]|uniref:hypothetical protein n=1 Tax=Actinoplanes subtropicus TaxID=543632 RepID=UPI000A80ED43|nr:hypothetical protein [Actinoplanes subtropicus]
MSRAHTARTVTACPGCGRIPCACPPPAALAARLAAREASRRELHAKMAVRLRREAADR